MGTADYCFSFFRKPIQNIEPIRAVGIVDVYRYITGHYAQPQTEALRLMATSPEAKRYKTTHFDYCTFSGLFRKRNEREVSIRPRACFSPSYNKVKSQTCFVWLLTLL